MGKAVEVSKIFKELGKIYFRYVGDNLEQVRVVGIQNTDVVKLNNIDTNEIFKEKIQILKENYQELIPDGLITFSIVGINETGDKDVMVCLYRESELQSTCIPYCICRQCVNDVFYNLFKTGAENENDLYGISITQDTCPVEIDFNIFRSCNYVEFSIGVHIYINDTLDSILSMIKTTKFDSVLENNFNFHHASMMKNNPLIPPVIVGNCIEGFCRNLDTLLRENNFMYDFYTGFNITPVKFNINCNNKGEYYIEPDDICKLSKLFKINISKLIITKYSKEIDLNEIKVSYILLRDNKDELFIVGYLSDNEYIESDEEINATASIMNKIAKVVDYYDKYSKK